MISLRKIISEVIDSNYHPVVSHTAMDGPDHPLLGANTLHGTITTPAGRYNGPFKIGSESDKVDAQARFPDHKVVNVYHIPVQFPEKPARLAQIVHCEHGVFGL